MRGCKSVIVSLCLFFITSTAIAQSDTVQQNRVHYTNQINSGILFGKKHSANTVTVSMVHGIRLRQISAGVGVGYETYSAWQLMPVFGNFSSYFRPGGKNPFIEIDAGYSFSWKVRQPFDFGNYDGKGGPIFRAALGYRITMERISLYVKAGYQYQRLVYEQSFSWANTTRIKMEMQRLNVRIGFGMN